MEVHRYGIRTGGLFGDAGKQLPSLRDWLWVSGVRTTAEP
ncbi:hypothetical protein RISK_002319 [Rhodopirellula islandica]|uniref:Uncharacterized protein n=1 Tax=Rhodopirellula islandica TaxID=595434 RepID=A0A0J1BGL0_RHOIS|nr:hypothetical protein RISK_002319 [Rhodopirellula islandica]